MPFLDTLKNLISSKIILKVIIIGTLLLILRIFFIPSPIYGGDEYAYYISGIYLKDLDGLYINDPNLQKVSTYLFLKIINIIDILNINTPKIITIYNILIFILSILIYYNIIKNKVVNSDKLIIITALIIFPYSAYSLAVMPDMSYFLIYSIIFLLVYKLYPVRIYTFSIMAGAFLGLMILIKPHAISIVLAVYFLVIFSSIKNKEIKFTEIISSLILITLFIYFTIIFTIFISKNEMSFLPESIFGKVYVDIIVNNKNSVFDIKKLIIYNFISHLVMISMLFIPIFYLALRQTQNFISRKSNPIKYDSINLFVLLSLFSTVIMTSVYTGKIALYDINEIYIIQGRYYEYLFPSLLTIIILNYEYLLKNHKTIRIFGVFISLTPIVWYLFFIQNIRLEPWTTSTFQAISTLHPNILSLSSIKYFYLFIIFLYGILVATLPKYFLKFFLLAVTFTWVTGFYLTTSWQYHNRIETAPYAEEGQKIIDSIPEENRLKGAIFSEERYGSTSYTLFSMAKNNKVPNDISFENFTAMLNNSEIKWLLISKKLNFDTSNLKNKIDFPHYTLIVMP